MTQGRLSLVARSIIVCRLSTLPLNVSAGVMDLRECRIRTAVGKAWECFWTLSLEDGQITVEGPFLDGKDSMLAITGGTGVYAGKSVNRRAVWTPIGVTTH